MISKVKRRSATISKACDGFIGNCQKLSDGVLKNVPVTRDGFSSGWYKTVTIASKISNEIGPGNCKRTIETVAAI